MGKKLEFRFAERKDTEPILTFIKELAKYEKLENEVVATKERLEEWTVYRLSGETLKELAE